MALGLHFFCACSATIDRGVFPWGVAPGYKLLRFQRAQLIRVLPMVIASTAPAIISAPIVPASILTSPLGGWGLLDRTATSTLFLARCSFGFAHGYCGHCPHNLITAHRFRLCPNTLLGNRDHSPRPCEKNWQKCGAFSHGMCNFVCSNIYLRRNLQNNNT